MIIKHFYSFNIDINKKNEKLNAQDWDRLRESEDTDFGIETSKNSYISNCKNKKTYERYAKRICELYGNDTLHIISLGCGKGILEWHIKNLCPEIYITATDYGEGTVNRLRDVLDVDIIKRFDIFNDSFDKLSIKDKDNIYLFCRVSTEFSKKQWIKILKKMNEQGVKKIIFIPTEEANLKNAFWEKYWFFMNILSGRKNAFAGRMYSRKAFEKIFQKGGYKVARRDNVTEDVIIELASNTRED